jgi:LmbE family N-acetylglucosaminyl deacetylase
MTRPLQRLIAAATIVSSAAVPAAAQANAAGTGGLVRLAQQEKLAGNWRRVLMIGAHPDDEDTQLLTILARGDGVHTAYLSLTRGDGGQNIIGPELGEALGVLRTGELASARRIDGGIQFFTRAYDFGFSKTAAETFTFWNRDSILKDMVRVIRRFKPQVIVSVWTGTPADGHGHHQASGILAPEAFRAAADSTRFPELQRQEGLAPWQAAKFYVSARGGGAATLTFDGGVLDSATGLSLRQLAALSRSQHRSQGQGTLEELGPSRSSLRLVDRAPGITGRDDSLFANIPADPIGADPHADAARLIRAGVVLDATTDVDEITPGDSMPVTLEVWNSGNDPITALPAVESHPSFTARNDDCPVQPRTVAAGQLFVCHEWARVRPDAHYTAPYYLAVPRLGAMYRWSGDPSIWGDPFAPPLEATFAVTVNGSAPVHASPEIVGRFRDQVLGEVRHPVMIVPKIAVTLDPGLLLWPTTLRTRTFTVSLQHLAHDTAEAQVALQVPPGWTASTPQTVRLSRTGERTVASFRVDAPARLDAGQYHIDALVIAGSDTFTTGVDRIRYPHVRDHNMLTTASATLTVTDIRFPAVGTIGYVRGGGDRVPEAMQAAGLRVDVLSDDSLERGALDRYHVIVIGPRAYEADSALGRAHPRLMAWLRQGGTLIEQYEQTPFVRDGYAPLPLTIVSPTQSRVTDETAPVRFLAPASSVLHTPNAIGERDFAGWVQERGLDYPIHWDAAWTPILEMHDPGDPPLDGGLLIARVGKGTAVYTGLSLHRELPAVVPGAWRLFANLLALGQLAPPTSARH